MCVGFAYTNSDCNGNCNCDSNGISISNAYSNVNAQADSDSETGSHTAAASHTGASAVSFRAIAAFYGNSRSNSRVPKSRELFISKLEPEIKVERVALNALTMPRHHALAFSKDAGL